MNTNEYFKKNRQIELENLQKDIDNNILCISRLKEDIRKLQTDLSDAHIESKSRLERLIGERNQEVQALEDRNTKLEEIYKTLEEKIKNSDSTTDEPTNSDDSDRQTDDSKAEQKSNEEKYSKYQEFLDQLKSFQEKSNQSFVDDSLEANKDKIVEISSLFQDPDTLKQAFKTTLLYVATFFKQLSVREFEKVVSFLLEDREISIKTSKKIDDQIVEAYETFHLGKTWQSSSEQRDQLMRECYLKAMRSESSRKIIDFSLPYIRENAKKFFEEENSLFIEQQFKKIRFLLFDDSSGIVFNVINISAEMAIADPDAYADSLLRLFFDLLRTSESMVNLASSLSEDKDAQENNLGFNEWIQIFLQNFTDEERKEISLFNRFLNQSTWNQKKQFVLSRLSFLIAQILERNDNYLEDEIEQFLNWAIEQHYQDAVLEIIKPLDSIGNFQQLDWIKKLLDLGNGDIQFSTRVFLYFKLNKSRKDIYKVLANIKKWLPKKEIDFNNFTPSNTYSLQLIFDYSFDMFNNLKSEDYGAYPSKFPLFSAIKPASPDSDLKILVEWLFYPKMDDILKDGIKIESLAAYILKGWFDIIWGFGKEPRPEAKETTKRILQQVVLETTPKQQKMLVGYWNEIAEELLEEADKLVSDAEEDDEVDKERKFYTQKFKNIKLLKTQFKELQNVES
jgi:hypothetical protein